MGARGTSILIDGGLHLLQDVVDLLQVLLGAQVRHGRQVVVLRERAVGSAGNAERVRGLRHVLGGEAASLDAERGVDGHQGAADLGVRGRVDLAALHAAKEVVEVLKPALAAIEAGRSLVANEVAALAHGLGLRVVADGTSVVGRSGVLVVVASLTILVRLPVGPRISTTHMAIVIIEAGRS